MKLKVGQQFEVVEVLKEGGYVDAFKIGGWSIGTRNRRKRLIDTVRNVPNTYKIRDMLPMYIHIEVKPVGRLTVTKIKNYE